MPTIEQDVRQIRQAVYGREVREAIADGIEKCYDDVSSAKTIADDSSAAATAAATSANTAAAAATTAAQNANDIVLVQADQPTAAGNKLWVKPESEEYQVPTYDEFEDLKSALSYEISVAGNVEVGGFGRDASNNIVKQHNVNMARNITPFLVKKGTTISVRDRDADYTFYMVTYTPDTFEYTGNTGWLKTYQLANDRYCYMAYRNHISNAKAENLVMDVRTVFDDTTLNAMTHNIIMADIFSTVSQKTIWSPSDYDNLSSKIKTNGFGSLISTDGWTDLPKDNARFAFWCFEYYRGYRVHFALAIDDIASSDERIYWRVVGRDDTIFMDWTEFNANTNNKISGLIQGLADLSDDVAALDSNKVLNGVFGRVTGLYNFEQGTLSAPDGEPYAKGYSTNLGRTISPFFAPKGTTVSVIDSDAWQFWPLTFNPDTFERTKPGWKTSYTFPDDCFCMFAFQRKTGGTVTVTPELVKTVFTEDSVNAVNSGVCIAPVIKEYFDNYDRLIIREPIIDHLPKDKIEIPTIGYKHLIQNVEGVSAAKPTIYRNGNYFCITYGENLDGTADDFPRVSNTGTLAMKYKFFKLENGEESEVSYGTFAQKGTAYTDYAGANNTFVGGCGLPSGRDGLQYFTSAYAGTNTYNGISNYGMTPCCCTVSVSSSGVTFGPIKELTLTYNGTAGKFDVSRIDPANVNYAPYITTAPPYLDGSTYRWIVPGKSSLIVMHSANGVDWTVDYVIATPYTTSCEVTTVGVGNSVLFAARSAGNVTVQDKTDTMYIGCINIANGTLTCLYQLPYIAVRTWLAKANNGILLFYTPYNKNIVKCLLIEYTSTSNVVQQFYFHEWFTLYKEGTWYMSCEQSSIVESNYTRIYIAGGNDAGPSTAHGMEFMELTLGTTKARKPSEIEACVV